MQDWIKSRVVAGVIRLFGLRTPLVGAFDVTALGWGCSRKL